MRTWSPRGLNSRGATVSDTSRNSVDAQETRARTLRYSVVQHSSGGAALRQSSSAFVLRTPRDADTGRYSTVAVWLDSRTCLRSQSARISCSIRLGRLARPDGKLPHAGGLLRIFSAQRFSLRKPFAGEGLLEGRERAQSGCKFGRPRGFRGKGSPRNYLLKDLVVVET